MVWYGMVWYGMVIGVKPEKVEEYKKLHASVFVSSIIPAETHSWFSPYFAFLLLLIASCVKQADPPLPYGTVPAEYQVRWHEMKYYALVCYGLNTYTKLSWN